MDARNIGIWRKCITTTVPDMPEGWLDRAGVVITAQTGVEVSNNHDVMSLEVCWVLSFETAMRKYAVLAFRAAEVRWCLGFQRHIQQMCGHAFLLGSFFVFFFFSF